MLSGLIRGLSQQKNRRKNGNKRKNNHAGKRGTATLNGERVRNLPRTASRSFGQERIHHRPGAWTASWTLGHVGIRQGPGAPTSSSLRLAPRWRSHLVPKQFPHRPPMIGQPACHRRCLSLLALRFWASPLLQGLMGTTEIVRDFPPDTSPSPALAAAGRHGDICALRWRAAHASSH
jgi:hypothetical protein